MEARLLGGMIRHPATIPAVLRFVGPEHFRSDPNRVVFSTLAALSSSKSAIDLVVLAEALLSSRRLVRAGGCSRLEDLWDAACPRDQVLPLAQQLREFGA